MFSRDIEVHSLNLESQRLVHEAESLMRQLRRHQAQLGGFIDDTRRELEAARRGRDGDKRS